MFIVAKIWKQFKCIFTGKCMNIVSYIHTVGYLFRSQGMRGKSHCSVVENTVKKKLTRKTTNYRLCLYELSTRETCVGSWKRQRVVAAEEWRASLHDGKNLFKIGCVEKQQSCFLKRRIRTSCSHSGPTMYF